MAGRRILDAAILFGATRNVARQHFRIRSEQLDVWSRTSSLAKAFKNQTDRVTLTASAAASLARRFRGSGKPTEASAVYTRGTEEETVPRPESVERTTHDVEPADGIMQDHHYTRSEENTTVDAQSEPALGIKQEKPARMPTPDGSIPPAGAPVKIVSDKPIDFDVTANRPGTVVQNGAIPEQNQSSAGELHPQTSSRSTIPDPKSQPTEEIPTHDVVPEEESIPEGINTDVFHTPRVKKMLGDTAKRGARAAMPLQGAKDTQKEKSELEIGNGQDTFNLRISEAAQPVALHAEQAPALKLHSVEQQTQSESPLQQSEDIHSLASDIANDARSAQPAPAEVRRLS